MSTEKSTKARRKVSHSAANAPKGGHGRPDSGEAFLPDPTEAHPHVHSKEPLADVLGEEVVRAATSGEDAFMDDTDAPTLEEVSSGLEAFEEASLEQEIADLPEPRPVLRPRKK